MQRLANLMCVCRGDLSSGLAKTKKLHGLAWKESRRVLEEEVYETLGLGLPGNVASRRSTYLILVKLCPLAQK